MYLAVSDNLQNGDRTEISEHIKSNKGENIQINKSKTNQNN